MEKVNKLFCTFLIALFFFIPTNQVLAASFFPTDIEILAVHEGESIQAAINKAKEGGVILVSAGTYYETIKLKKGIVLRSESGAEQTIINGSQGSGTVVEIAGKSTLDGFTITGRVDTDKAKTRHAVECINISATIKNNIIRDNKGTGLYISGKKATVSASNNRIHVNQGAGIGIEKESKALIFDNQCYGNKEAGIGIQLGASPVIERNKCFQNQMAGIGVRHKESAPIIKDNECYNNELAGIGLEKAATATITNNYLHGNGRSGIGLTEGSSAIIEKNEIKENTLAGIGSKDKSTLTVKNNQIHHNRMSGITVLDATQAIIEGNTIQGNGTQGIVCSSATITVKNNKVLDNIHHGISFYRNAQGEVNGNIINNNGANDMRGAGILVVSSDKPVIRNNEFNNNYGPGVYTRRCSPLIEENVFLNDLVFTKFHASPTIRKNTFYSKGKSGGKTVKSGVDVRKISHPLIEENEFYGKFAISIRDKSNPLVLKNKFSGNHKISINGGRSGIKVDRTANPSIIDNIFYNGNKIVITGQSFTKNVILTHGRTGKLVKSKLITVVEPKLHGGDTVLIAGNLFIGGEKKRK